MRERFDAIIKFIQTLQSRLDFNPNIYLTDFVDILIIALFIYSLFLFLRRTRTYMVFLGLAFTAALYYISELLNLYLTFLTLRYLVGFSIVIFAVIFQNEIRKYLELLGLIGARQIKVGLLAPKSPSTSEIIQASVQMAQAKIGALIVIQGKDNIEPFIDGGTLLDGVISEEVLCSIFDDHSAGHDGAVIIRNNRIVKFGAHLPLSTNFKEIGKRGTRHSAALGLSENTDALCIVISEERGTITLCKDGKLKTLTDFSDLEKEFTRYIKSKFETQTKGFFDHIVKHNTSLKLGAVASASLIWFLTAYQAGIIERTYPVKINLINTPNNITIEDYSPKEIEVTLRGRGESLFSNINDSTLKIDYDTSDIQGGLEKKNIVKKDFSLPPNLALIDYEPTSFLLTSKKYYTTQIKITAKTTGTLRNNLKLVKTEITPDSVEVQVPEGMQPPQEIPTETIDISNQTDSVIVPVKILIPSEIKIQDKVTTVNVALTIEE